MLLRSAYTAEKSYPIHRFVVISGNSAVVAKQPSQNQLHRKVWLNNSTALKITDLGPPPPPPHPSPKKKKKGGGGKFVTVTVALSFKPINWSTVTASRLPITDTFKDYCFVAKRFVAYPMP